MVGGYQSGCLRARVPRTDPGERTCAVILNTGGGVTGGDRLQQSVTWRSCSEAVITTQAAEKVYRSAGGEVVVDTRLTVGEQAAR